MTFATTQKTKIIPFAVKKAFEHVKSIYPAVTQVAFDEDQRWLYSDASGDAPDFEGKVNVDLLELAADALDYFPVTFTEDEILNRLDLAENVHRLAKLVVEQAKTHGFDLEVDAIREAVEQFCKFHDIEASESERVAACHEAEKLWANR